MEGDPVLFNTPDPDILDPREERRRKKREIGEIEVEQDGREKRKEKEKSDLLLCLDVCTEVLLVFIGPPGGRDSVREGRKGRKERKEEELDHYTSRQGADGAGLWWILLLRPRR